MFTLQYFGIDFIVYSLHTVFIPSQPIDAFHRPLQSKWKSLNL